MINTQNAFNVNLVGSIFFCFLNYTRQILSEPRSWSLILTQITLHSANFQHMNIKAPAKAHSYLKRTPSNFELVWHKKCHRKISNNSIYSMFNMCLWQYEYEQDCHRMYWVTIWKILTCSYQQHNDPPYNCNANHYLLSSVSKMDN